MDLSYQAEMAWRTASEPTVRNPVLFFHALFASSAGETCANKNVTIESPAVCLCIREHEPCLPQCALRVRSAEPQAAAVWPGFLDQSAAGHAPTGARKRLGRTAGTRRKGHVATHRQRHGDAHALGAQLFGQHQQRLHVCFGRDLHPTPRLLGERHNRRTSSGRAPPLMRARNFVRAPSAPRAAERKKGSRARSTRAAFRTEAIMTW